jgi:hypothetical protein
MATRMRGVPKFLLPCDENYTTLIEIHIFSLLEICDQIWIPTRPEMVMLLDSMGLATSRVAILPMQTENMTQTISRVVHISQANNFQLVMPDTFYLGEKPYSKLTNEPELTELACWEIRPEQKGKLGQVLIANDQALDIRDKDPNCDYNHSWGSMTFNSSLLEFASMQDPHIGYAVAKAIKSGEKISTKLIDGKYFDCGTPKEYLSMLVEAMVS